tara:strand:+ start:1546 stop:2013 length:468 start_codon:yes stop_codon:yes gene_type:complete
MHNKTIMNLSLSKIIIIFLGILGTIIFLNMNNNFSFNEIIYTYFKILGIIVFICSLCWLRIKYDKRVGATGLDIGTPLTWENIKKDHKNYMGKNISPTNLFRAKFSFICICIVYYISFVDGIFPTIIMIIALPILLYGGYWLFFKAKINNKWFKK